MYKVKIQGMVLKQSFKFIHFSKNFNLGLIYYQNVYYILFLESTPICCSVSLWLWKSIKKILSTSIISSFGTIQIISCIYTLIRICAKNNHLTSKLSVKCSLSNDIYVYNGLIIISRGFSCKITWQRCYKW